MVEASTSSPGNTPVDSLRHELSADGPGDDWMLGDTSEWEASDLGDTAESAAVQAEEPARDTIPSPPPEAGAEATPITLPAPPPIGDFDCSS